MLYLPASVSLADGERVTLRAIKPEDAAALHAAFHRLSAESRYHRFFGMVNDLPPGMLRYLTEVDGHDHVALVAVTPGADGFERIVGVARCVRDDERRDVAEAAFTVADEVQRKGLGLRLFQALSTAARAEGVRTFRLEVKRENIAMRKLVADVGGALVGTYGADLTYEVEIRRSILRILLDLSASQTRAWFRLMSPPPSNTSVRRSA